MKTKFITSILLLTLLWPTHSTYALENDCLRPVAAGEKKGPSDGGTPLVTWVGTPHPLIKEVIDGILNSEALDIKNLQQRIVQKGIKVYLVVLGPLPRGVKFRTILVDEELRKEIIKMVGHEIPHGRSYLLCVSSEVIYGLPTLRQWKIKHELYHMIYPPLELELQFQLVREASPSSSVGGQN